MDDDLYCAIGQVNASIHAALPLAYSLLSSLVVVRWRAETPRGGRSHHVWRGGLVRPGAIRSAVRRRRRSTAGLVPQVHVRESHGDGSDAHRAFRAIIRPIWVLLHDGGG